MKGKLEKTSITGGNLTYNGQLLIIVKLVNETTYVQMQTNIVLKINPLWLCETAWFPWQPIEILENGG